jgi:ribonuclease BN (tRNA processing enzyme)
VVSDHWELEIEIAGHTLTGSSVAALATAFALDRVGTAIDMGRCSARLAAQDTVLLTHCHSDHVAGLVAWLSAHTRRHRDRPTRVVVPAERHRELLDALAIWPDLDGVRRRVDLADALVPASPGTTVELCHGGSATAFSVRHNTVALGWSISIGDGSRPEFAFAGDGTVEPFRDDPSLLDVDVAVVDCSFVEPGTRVAARLGGHGHLTDWLELLPDLQCDALVLAHLPPEATTERIAELLPDELPGTSVVVPWLTTAER